MDNTEYEYRRTDLATGETKRWTGRPGARFDSTNKAPFLMLYQEAAREIATNRALQGFDFRVFIFLTGILDTENWIDVHHGRIARQMTAEGEKPVQRAAVSRSIKKLTEQGILLKGGERTYRLNPGVGWKGTRATQWKAEKEHTAGRLSVVRN